MGKLLDMVNAKVDEDWANQLNLTRLYQSDPKFLIKGRSKPRNAVPDAIISVER
jgi:hypothetical protein